MFQQKQITDICFTRNIALFCSGNSKQTEKAMTASAQKASPTDPKARNLVGLRAAITILERWKATQEQVQKVLRVSRTTLHRAKTGVPSLSLDSDQLERISMVLNIHAAMRILFENPANVYGFMGRANDNEFFNGRAPLDVMAQGSMLALMETYRRIDGLRGGMW